MPNSNERARYPRFISSHLTDVAVQVSQVRGSAEISGLWEFHITLLLDQDVPLDAVALLEAPAALYWETSDGELEMPFYGVVREVENLEALPGHWIQYHLVLVPNLWFLSQTFRSRVFLELSVPDIVDQVLNDAGLESGTDYEWSVSDRGAYPARAMVVQYQESDLDFVSRLLEHEGVFFFAHVEGDREHWVLGDHNQAFAAPELAEIEYDPADHEGASTDHRFRRFRDRLSSVPRHVVTRDYASPTPLVRVQREHEVTSNGMGLLFLTDDHLRDDADATRLARTRAEEVAVCERTFRAQGAVQGLRPGHRIELNGHPVDDLNAEYVVVSVDYDHGPESRHGVPELTVELIGAEVPYRPPRITARPRLHGVLPAHIDGEVVGVPAPLDDEGRYKVLLPYDSASEAGGRASCWIRMAQTFAGPGYGMHFPLHVGTEVLLVHVDGDPDRPVIAGAVPNPATSSPVVDANATQSVVRTKAGIVQEYEDDAHPS